MPETNPGNTPVQVAQVVEVLAYETSAPRRPRWMYAVFAIYGIGAIALLTLPIWGSWLLGEKVYVQAGILIACIVACGLALMILPVRIIQRRRIPRRSIWVPIIASGALAGLVLAGAVMAWCEYLRIDGTQSAYILCITGGIAWLGWSLIFALIAFSQGPESIGMKLHRTLIAGSVLELLVAVPTHIVVRRRPECCAGILTGSAICIGVIVMFVSLGPSVLLLFYRRGRMISPRIKQEKA